MQTRKKGVWQRPRVGSGAGASELASLHMMGVYAIQRLRGFLLICYSSETRY